MIVLVSGSTVSVKRIGGAHLGALLVPRAGNRAPADMPFALDNDAFTGFDRDRFVAMLKRYQGLPGCLWCAAPDVVGDARATLLRFRLWRPVIQHYGYPVAFVAQDGMERLRTPWHLFDCLFIGGSTGFKLGPIAAWYASEAKRRGKWLHLGRCNTRRRFEYAASIGVDSVDGSAFSRYGDTHLPWAVQYAAAKQHRMEVDTW